MARLKEGPIQLAAVLTLSVVVLAGLAVVAVSTGAFRKIQDSASPSAAPFDVGDPSGNDSELLQAVSAQCAESAASCDSASVAALDDARRDEGLRNVVLPASFWSLPYDQQELILVNEERVSRRLPPVQGVTATLDKAALRAAKSHKDPTYGPAPFGWASNWAEGPNTVVEDLEMMYVDGYSGAEAGNISCTSPHGSGCWGHRRNILQEWPQGPAGSELQMGAGCVPFTARGDRAALSCGTLFVETIRPAHNTFTWQKALKLGA